MVSFGRLLTEEEKKFIENNYKKMTLIEMGKHINRTPASLSKICSRLIKKGNSKIQYEKKFYNRRWSEDEKAYLSENIGIKTLEEMASRLNRTPIAVKVQIGRMQLSLYDNFISQNTLCKELNKSKAVVRKWVKRGWIKCSKASFNTGFGTTPCTFDEEEIVRFLGEHYTLFDPYKIENPYFKNIVRDAYKKNHGSHYEIEVVYKVPGHNPPTKLILSR